MKYDTKRRPHRDLETLVDYQLIRISERLEEGDCAGINHDMTACLLSLSLWAESLINLGGFSIFRERFKEKDSYHKRVEKILPNFDVNDIEKLREILAELQTARNSLAHPKPSNIEVTVHEGRDEFSVFDRDYRRLLNLDFLEKSNQVLEDFYFTMCEHPKVKDYGFIETAVQAD
ncbi:MAG: hypothetical protein ABNH16_11660 [Thalassolituus sp.]|jgi:hypothetical protein|nr:MAG: hypothetical protein COA68_02400 [Oceanobacter sp.]